MPSYDYRDFADRCPPSSATAWPLLRVIPDDQPGPAQAHRHYDGKPGAGLLAWLAHLTTLLPPCRPGRPPAVAAVRTLVIRMRPRTRPGGTGAYPENWPGSGTRSPSPPSGRSCTPPESTPHHAAPARPGANSYAPRPTASSRSTSPMWTASCSGASTPWSWSGTVPGAPACLESPRTPTPPGPPRQPPTS
jgi:hypothetical protein